MGMFQRVKGLFRQDKVTVAKVIDLLNRGNSIMNVNRDLYNIPEIRTAINFVAEKVGSVPFYHVQEDIHGNSAVVNDRLQYILTVRANPYQGPQVFWTYVVTRLLLANNVFIMPEWDDKGELYALYPLPFTQFTFGLDENGKLTITFPYGGNYTFYYEDILHLQRFPTQKGGAEKQAVGNYEQIVSTMQAQAVNDSENSQRIAAIMKIKTPLKGDDLKKRLQEFKDLFLTSENTTGFGMVGGDIEVQDINLSKSVLNKGMLESIVSYMYIYFATSKEIINNMASELQYEQWVDNAIKPIVNQIKEEGTYKLLTPAQINRGEKVKAELVDLEISTLSAKTAFFKEMIFGAVMNRNEIRLRLGMPRGPAELDQFALSKNFETPKPGEEGGDVDGEGTGEEGTE